jgi:hypothetical protein
MKPIIIRAKATLLVWKGLFLLSIKKFRAMIQTFSRTSEKEFTDDGGVMND